MTLPRVRYTVKRMMVAVAFAGLAIAVAIELARLHRLSEGYRFRAASIRGWERMARSDATLSQADWAAKIREIERLQLESRGAFCTPKPYSPERCSRLIPHLVALRLKYERASRYPWFSVEPDPPTPE